MYVFELSWIRLLLKDLQGFTSITYETNVVVVWKVTLNITGNIVVHDRNKYIQMDCNQICNFGINLRLCPSSHSERKVSGPWYASWDFFDIYSPTWKEYWESQWNKLSSWRLNVKLVCPKNKLEVTYNRMIWILCDNSTFNFLFTLFLSERAHKALRIR